MAKSPQWRLRRRSRKKLRTVRELIKELQKIEDQDELLYNGGVWVEQYQPETRDRRTKPRTKGELRMIDAALALNRLSSLLPRVETAHGSSRWVLLAWRWAFKFPYSFSYGSFLHGLLANMQENHLSRMYVKDGDQRFCPVLWRIKGGFLVVMPRCEPISDDELEQFHASGDADFDFTQLVEMKLSSLGWLGDRIVAVDYGN